MKLLFSLFLIGSASSSAAQTPCAGGTGGETRCSVGLQAGLTWSFLFACVLLAFGAPATARTIAYNGAQLDLIAPSGYCELGDSVRERQVHEYWHGQMETPDNKFLGVFGLCGEVAEIKSGKRKQFDNWGQWLAIKGQNGKPYDAGGRTRGMFISALLSTTSKRQIDEAFEQTRRELKSPTETVKSFGFVSHDSNAAYAAVGGRNDFFDGSVGYVAGVTGITLIRRQAVATNLFRRHTRQPSVDSLLAVQQGHMANFVAANKD